MSHAKHDTAAYYKMLARRIALVIVVVAVLPYILALGLFYSSYNESIRSQVLLSLKGVVESHKRTIEDFLAERLANLKETAIVVGVDGLSGPQRLAGILDALQRAYGAFVDLGFLDQSGRHLAYAGPYRDQVAGADYSNSEWFQEVMRDGVKVSDVFLGVRGVPHFIAAVKLSGGDKDYVLRATIDSARFTNLVEAARLGSTGEAYIVNRKGLYQTQVRGGGSLLTPSGLDLPPHFEGVRVLSDVVRDGKELVLAKTWVKGGDWLLICQQSQSDAFGSLYKARRLALSISLAGLLLLVVITLFFTRRLVGRIAASDQDMEVLNQQVIQSGKLASLGELAAGVAHEINNPVAIMVEEAGWIGDLMEEDAGLLKQSPNQKEYLNSLNQIRTQGQRCKEITTKLLGFARRGDAPTEPTRLNNLAQEVASILSQRAHLSNVRLKLDLDPSLPTITASPSEMQQVVMNLANNALDAMGNKGGDLTLGTRLAGPGWVELFVKDTGPGIPREHLSRIFDPFFTTKPVGKGTGLGLSICYGIVNKLGGSLKVESAPGRGATFTVHMPTGQAEETETDPQETPEAGDGSSGSGPGSE